VVPLGKNTDHMVGKSFAKHGVNAMYQVPAPDEARGARAYRVNLCDGRELCRGMHAPAANGFHGSLIAVLYF